MKFSGKTSFVGTISCWHTRTKQKNIFQPIQYPVNFSDTIEEKVIDEEYWNITADYISPRHTQVGCAKSAN